MAYPKLTADIVLEAVKENFAEIGASMRERDRKSGLIVKSLGDRIDETKRLAIANQRGFDQIRAGQKPKPSICSILLKSILARSRAIVMKADLASTAEQLYPGNTRIVDAIRDPGDFVAKAATNPAQTTVNGWAAELAGPQRNFGLIASLAPASIYSQLLARGVGVSLDGMASMKFISRAAPTGAPSPFVGEGQPIPVRALDFDSGPLQPHKCATMSLLTGELARQSAPAAETIIGQALSDDLAIAIDGVLLDSNAASSIRPAGLLYGLTSLTPSPALDASNAAGADIAALAGAIVPGAVSLTIIAASAQAASIALLYGNSSLDIISTDALPAGTLIAIDASDFASVTQVGGAIEVSSDATVVMKTDPSPVATGSSGAGAITDAPHTSVWQHDLIAIRVLEDISWMLRRSGRVAFVQGVSW